VKTPLLLGLVAAVALSVTAAAGGIDIGTPLISGDISTFEADTARDSTHVLSGGKRAHFVR
jgi:hypothetical protein